MRPAGHPANLATCAFSQFAPDMGVPVRVSVGGPGRRLPYRMRHHLGEAAPSLTLLRCLDPGAFTDAYRRHLDDVGVETIARIAYGIRLVERVGGGVPLVLLCHEDLSRPGARCHRTVLADWWRERTSEPVPELGLHHGTCRPGTSALF